MRDRLWWKRLRSRAHVLPYGVDHNRFRPGDRLQARRKLRLSDSTRIVLFPNTPTEFRKRLDLAEAAISIVRKMFSNTVLQVTTGVRHSEMPDYYRAAD